MTAEPTTDARDAEIAALRARVADLEAQLAEQTRRTTTLVAEAQEKLYWLERWQVDLDKVMRRRGALQALEALKAVRALVRRARALQRRLAGGA
jgi:uncharacterized coiled-coil protein SlyX